jgi:hypothetical protein
MGFDMLNEMPAISQIPGDPLWQNLTCITVDLQFIDGVSRSVFGTGGTRQNIRVFTAHPCERAKVWAGHGEAHRFLQLRGWKVMSTRDARRRKRSVWKPLLVMIVALVLAVFIVTLYSRYFG